MTDETPGDGAAAAARSTEPLVLVLIGLGVAAALFAASALPVVVGRGDDESGDDVTAAAPPAVTADVEAPDDTAATTVPAPTVTTEPPTNEPPSTTAAPTSTAPPTTEPGEVPESVAVVIGGQIFLEGAVPDEASRNEIVELAAGIFGADNVIDNYVLDERASDPNLGNIRVDDTVLFAPDSAQISPEFEPLLNQGLALLTIRPAATFVIFGHTDSTGSDDYNLRLSQARADAVVQWWVDRGVDPARLTAIGLGESEPLDTNDTPEGRERNRRIEVTIENLLVGS